MQAIAYLLYGSRREYHVELSYSVLSALRHLRRAPAPIRIALITDERNVRSDLPVEHILFSKAEIEAWTDGGYVHQAKLHALDKALDRMGGRVALVDTDTCFIDHPSKLFERIAKGRSLMHASEGPVGDQACWGPILDRLGEGAEVAGYPVSRTQTMYNSGVIGIDPADRSLLADARDLLRHLYELAPVFNVEQYALGTVLNARTRLSVCPDVVKHYWGHERRFFRAQSERLFGPLDPRHFDALVEAKDLPEIGYPSMSLVDRVAARLVGRLRGAGGNYTFAYLAYRCALRTSERDPMYANIWARVALDALRIHRDQGDGPGRTLQTHHIRRDFQSFDEGAIEQLWWTSAETKRCWKEFWEDPRSPEETGATPGQAQSVKNWRMRPRSSFEV